MTHSKYGVVTGACRHFAMLSLAHVGTRAYATPPSGSATPSNTYVSSIPHSRWVDAAVAFASRWTAGAYMSVANRCVRALSIDVMSAYILSKRCVELCNRVVVMLVGDTNLVAERMCRSVTERLSSSSDVSTHLQYQIVGRQRVTLAAGRHRNKQFQILRS